MGEALASENETQVGGHWLCGEHFLLPASDGLGSLLRAPRGLVCSAGMQESSEVLGSLTPVDGNKGL